MPDPIEAAVNARIVYWGLERAGVSTTLRHIFAKLRPDHRAELREVPTRIDPTVSYEVLPIKLGAVGGVDTRIEVVGVPGAPEHAPTRKQLLDRVDGVVFVADARRERIEASTECFAELRRALAAYGRTLESVPLVIQINQRDLADRATVEDLVRKLDAPHAPRFATVATEGTGVLQVLSSISKSVVRSLREPPGNAAAPSRTSGDTAAPSRTSGDAAAPSRRPGDRQSPPKRTIPAPTPVPIPVPASTAVAPTASDEEWPAPIRSRRLRTPAAPLDAPGFPPALEEVTRRLDPAPPATLHADPAAPAPEPIVASDATARALRIVSVGAATCENGLMLQLPLEIEDAQGRRFGMTLSLTLGPLLGE